LPAWENKYENGSFLSWLFVLRVLLASVIYLGLCLGKNK
jgi:hypothetical protein